MRNYSPNSSQKLAGICQSKSLPRDIPEEIIITNQQGLFGKQTLLVRAPIMQNEKSIRASCTGDQIQNG
ncbi:MAG: hypothetical protein HKN23_08205 [Verrucomicrobiales bacterium]|nr:hypothetical protein [Verrucomicrobiales bacterium]